MTPFEVIKEMKDYVATEKTTKNLTQTITLQEHLEFIDNFLGVLSSMLKDAEYNYDILPVEQSIDTLKNYYIVRKKLNDDVIIFQPVAIGEAELNMIDISSLADVLKKLKDAGKIREDILVLPPNINVFRAKLVQNEEDNEEDWEELKFN